MILGCSSPDLLRLDDYGFTRDVAALLIVIIPSAIGFTLWRVFVTNRSESQQLVSLGMSETGGGKNRIIPGSLVRLSATVISFIAVYLIGPDNLELFLSKLLTDADFLLWFGKFAVLSTY